MAKFTFKGFDSTGKTKPFTELTDKALIKCDILKHFNTRKGTRIMHPTFGSNLWDYLFEPLDEITRDAIFDDVNTVIRFDPRVAVINTDIQEHDHGIVIAFQLHYVAFDSIENFTIFFDRRIMAASEYSN